MRRYYWSIQISFNIQKVKLHACLRLQVPASRRPRMLILTRPEHFVTLFVNFNALQGFHC
jgi:hypothetical protein